MCDEDDFALTDICYSLSVCDQTEEECGQDTCQSGTKVHSPAHHNTDLLLMFQGQQVAKPDTTVKEEMRSTIIRSKMSKLEL